MRKMIEMEKMIEMDDISGGQGFRRYRGEREEGMAMNGQLGGPLWGWNALYLTVSMSTSWL